MATKKTELNIEVGSKSVVSNKITDKNTSELAKLTREELSKRFHANIAERKRLSGENKLLLELWRKASPKNKKPAPKPTAKPTTKSTATKGKKK
jgi:hypothetical protein